MKTLYLRNVPEDVTDRLERLAAREGLSVSALAIRELAVAARRADNPGLVADLPDLGIPAAETVRVLEEGRNER
jgi:plasmid stability protein